MVTIRELLKQPDFEARADQFVKEVLELAEKEFPSLLIDAENSTKNTINVASLKKKQSSFDRKNEIGSAFCNIASVNIWGFDGSQQVPDMNNAINKIHIIAQSHGGDPLSTSEEEKSELNDDNVPHALLMFFFE